MYLKDYADVNESIGDMELRKIAPDQPEYISTLKERDELDKKIMDIIEGQQVFHTISIIFDILCVF